MKHIFYILFTAVVCLNACAQTTSVPYANEVDSLINSAVRESKIPGAVLCVVVGDKVQYMQAYGYRQVYPDTLPMTISTQFDLASLSKIVGTGMSLMTLVDKGLINIDDPITKYLPEYTHYKDETIGDDRDQTVLDFLTHTSGLPAYASYTELLKDEPLASPARRKELLLRYMATCKRRAPAGTDVNYSCLNFISLQYLIERVTGQRLDDFASKNVFKPLKMKNTCYYPLGSSPKPHTIIAPTEKIAPYDPSVKVPSIIWTGYKDIQYFNRKRTIKNNPCYEALVHDPLAREINAGVSGNAGVFSTAEDLSRMAIWMLNPEEKKGPMRSSTLRMMMQVPEGYEAFGRALSWDQSSDYAGCKGSKTSSKAVCHTGYTGTSMVVDPEKKVAVILLTNRAHPSDGGGVAAVRRAVADAIFGCY